MFTDADNFGIELPPNMPVDHKALMMACTFLIDCTLKNCPVEHLSHPVSTQICIMSAATTTLAVVKPSVGEELSLE